MPSDVAKKTVQPDVAPDFAIRLKCHTQAHFRETGELNRSSKPVPKTKAMNTSWLFRPQIEMSISESDRWYVQLDGLPVAIIENPTDADMF